MDTKSIEIGLWLLTRVKAPYPDELGACIVAAKDEPTARQQANQASGAEGYVWTNGNEVNARHLGTATDEVSGILLSSLEIPKPKTEGTGNGIWMLTRTETPDADEWGACIVASGDEESARELANQASGAEGYVWTDGHRVSARNVGTACEGVSGILLSSPEVPE